MRALIFIFHIILNKLKKFQGNDFHNNIHELYWNFFFSIAYHYLFPYKIASLHAIIFVAWCQCIYMDDYLPTSIARWIKPEMLLCIWDDSDVLCMQRLRMSCFCLVLIKFCCSGIFFWCTCDLFLMKNVFEKKFLNFVFKNKWMRVLS